MSAVPQEPPRLEARRPDDLDEVIAVEEAIYSHPWTRGNFIDSLRAGYDCRTWRLEGELVGYFILMCAVGEGHLLNLSIAAKHQRSGHGRALLHEAAELARRRGATGPFLAVRPRKRAGAAPRACSWKCARAISPRRRSTRAAAFAGSRCVKAITPPTRAARTPSCSR